MVATVRYDDQYGNGHNSFAITSDICCNGRDHSGGCCHEEIAKHIPALAPFIKWHLCSTDGPMHYLANIVYLAGERDHCGLLKGEFRQHTSRGKNQVGGVGGVPHWELKFPPSEQHDVYAKDKPASVTFEYVPSGITGYGKARELDAARSVAIWPEATDEQLSVEPEALKLVLLERLPRLLEEFKAAMESLGFVW